MKSAPRRRVPALILDIDQTGAKVKFQSQTFKVARFRARKKGEEEDAEEAELDPAQVRCRRCEADLGSQLGQMDVGRIWKRMGRTGLLPCVRVPRRAGLVLCQKWSQCQISHPCQSCSRLRVIP